MRDMHTKHAGRRGRTDKWRKGGQERGGGGGAQDIEEQIGRGPSLFCFFHFFLASGTSGFNQRMTGLLGQTDERDGWPDGWMDGAALADGRRRLEDLAEAYPLPWLSPSTFLAGHTGRSHRAQFSFLALGPCVSCIR